MVLHTLSCDVCACVCFRSADFDQLFIAVDSSNIHGGKISEQFNRKKALNRREWLQVLVQAPVMKYVLAGHVDDISTAVSEHSDTNHALSAPQHAMRSDAQCALTAVHHMMHAPGACCCR
jgi:hypothetical protein